MILLRIDFDGDWLKSKSAEGVRVVRLVEKWIVASGSACVKASACDSLVVELDQARRGDFEKALAKKLADDFKAKDMSSLVTYSELSSKVESGRESTRPAGDEPDTGDVKSSDGTPDNAKKPVGKDGKKTGNDGVVSAAAAPHRPTLDEMLDQAPFKYSRELVAYMREADAVIPMLAKMGAMDSFWHQSLLVSIDDGYGLTEFLRALVRLYASHGIARKDLGDRAAREVRIGVGGHDLTLYEDWDSALSVAKEMRRANENNAGSRPLLCLDVGAWQDKLARGEVKSYLRRLNASCGNFTLVFRVPFVEPRTMSAVGEALADIFSVRPLAVPPTSLDSLASYAKENLSKRGFALSDDAVGAVEQMIIREKGDDSFFGYKTVDKIVDRIIYEKALVNCRSGRADRGIGCGDVVALSSGADGEDPRRELESLVGLGAVKEKVNEIVAQIKAQRLLSSKGRKVARPAIHMLFSGNPGTGKTTVARIVGNLLKSEGVLRKGHLVEVRGRDLCGEYIGQTAPRTSAICRDAYGSVLFIDEAYSLFRGDGSDRDYGREALDTLIAEMENHRDDMCVIMAGYADEMETMLGGNSGLKSRIPFFIDFPNYTKKELGDIFFSMLGDSFEYEKPLEKAVRGFFDNIPDEALAGRGFSNARFVRNLYERTWGRAAYRSRLENGNIKILASDLMGAAEDKEFKQLMSKTARRPIGFGPWSS